MSEALAKQHPSVQSMAHANLSPKIVVGKMDVQITFKMRKQKNSEEKMLLNKEIYMIFKESRFLKFKLGVKNWTGNLSALKSRRGHSS